MTQMTRIRADSCVHRSLSGEDDADDVWILSAHHCQKLSAAHPRHLLVGNYDVHGFVREHFESFLRGSGGQDMVWLLEEDSLEPR